ncbi:MAG: hypothetical protein AAF441_18170 [Pseudomonadota bacterium]
MTGTPSPVLVPIRVDALWSDGSTHLSPPTVRYDALKGVFAAAPANLPWLGDTTSVAPSDSAPLPAGLHLHWTLPRALRTGQTVYRLDTRLYNELVYNGVPASLVKALKTADGGSGKDYTQDELLALLSSLASGQSVISDKSGFALSDSATTYDELTSSDSGSSISTYMPAFSWDANFLQIYAPSVINLAAQAKFMPVPNRWLVLREDSDDTMVGWVVESDRLTDPAETSGDPASGAGPTAVPGVLTADDVGFVGNNTVSVTDAYSYLGQMTDLSSWGEATANRLTPLTALGHGVADFATFYPNCQGVFGFNDATATEADAYTYTVIGWFSEASNDPLSSTYDVAPWAAADATQADRAAALQWSLANADWTTVSGSVYGAQIEVTGSDCELSTGTVLSGVDVAIGNTTAEALSAQLTVGQSGTLVGLSPESALNAAQAGALKQALDPDGPAVIENALHDLGFDSTPGGWLWRVAAPENTTAGLSAEPSQPVTVTDTVAKALNALNTAQHDYDMAIEGLRAQRHLLFTDWCRASHLGTDASTEGFPNGSTYSNQNVTLSNVSGYTVQTAAASVDTAAVGASSDDDMLTYTTMTALYLAYSAAQTALAAMSGGTGMRLQRQPAEPFRRPNDPVVSMVESSGSDLTTSPASSLPVTTVDAKTVLTVSTITAADSAPAYMPSGWDQNANAPSSVIVGGLVSSLSAVTATQSWRPLLLTWEVEFQQYSGAGTITPADVDTTPFSVTDYDADFITSGFSLDTAGIDYAMPTTAASSSNVASYMGRIPLTSSAMTTMKAQILELTGQAADPPSAASDLNLPGALDTTAIRTLLWSAYSSDTTVLNQVLGGFNDRLLMINRPPQISGYTYNLYIGGDTTGVSLPTWDVDHQTFFPQIGEQKLGSPYQLDIYNPIRAGMCQITELHLIDAFGQVRTWTYSAVPSNTAISQALPHKTPKAGDSAPSFFMAPRYAQPARLRSNWLAADGSNAYESGSSPATTPICGWLALNRVNENIMVFEQDGTLVGWVPDGGGSMVYQPDKSAADITDPWLTQVVTQIEAASNSFYDDVNTALLTIEPLSHRTMAARSVLESRPLAIARFSMALELKGTPSPHQGFEALATMTTTGESPDTGTAPDIFVVREDCGFPSVDMPIRLGDVSMDDDGLVLYWTISDSTIASSYTLVGSAAEKASGDEPTVSLTSAPGTAATQVLMLMDPRSPVHLTSGLLPVKGLSVPPTMYQAAVENMEYLMQVDTVLTPSEGVAMPLPGEIQGSWTWVYEDDGSWAAAAAPAKVDAKIHPKANPAVLRQGFLKAGQDDAN